MALKPGQVKCINTLDEPLVVAAGAGSGKTFTLTRRIVHALESGYVDDIDQILAITFTKKSAGELKSRVKSSLRGAGMVDQALKVDEAWISTIHGMCARILRAHAVQLDIDPAFSVVDDATLRDMRSRAIEAALVEAREQNGEALSRLFAEYQSASQASFSASSVQDMLDALVVKMSSLPDGADSLAALPKTIEPAFALSEFAATMEAMLGWADQQKDSASKDSFTAAATEARDMAQKALDEGKVDSQSVLAVMSLAPSGARFGSKDFKAAVKSAVSDLRIYAAAVRLSAAKPQLETLLALSRRASELLFAAKAQAGLLSNDDLLMKASKAIVEHPDIASRYEDKFKLIMVDEFQDTDQMQVDMIKLLAGPGAKRLCVVGDAQQSIYRFRGADVSVYRSHLSQVERENEQGIVLLPDNFRSHRDILSFVDRVFERDAMFGKEFMSLSPSRDESEVKRPFMGEGPRIFVQHASYPSSGGTELLREKAAKAIAQRFAEFAQKGHSASDMVILLGTMSNAAIYAQAVRDAGLPCVISGGSVLKDARETALVCSLLQWLADPQQTEQLFNALAGPLFGLGPDDLIALATREVKEGTYVRRDLDAGLAFFAHALSQGNDASASVSPELACAVDVLSRALSRVGVDAAADILRDVFVESGWISRMQQQGEEGRSSVANVYKLIRLAREQERADSLGIVSLAKRFSTSIAQTVEAPGALSVSGGNFVRIMTMHASKGLEFPIVAVAEMKSTSLRPSRLSLDVVDGRLYASLDLGNSADGLSGVAKIDNEMLDSLLDEDLSEDDIPVKMAACDDALELRALMRARASMGDAEEAKRLLYVALTRAKEALIISTFGNRTKDRPNGAPKNVFASIGPALTGGEDWFDRGASLFDFGGEHPASVSHVAFNADGSEEGAFEEGNGCLDEDAPACSEGSSPGRPGEVDALDVTKPAVGSSSEGFAVPFIGDRFKTDDVAAESAHKDIFSYSSVADASHEGGLLEELASRFMVKTDGGEVCCAAERDVGANCANEMIFAEGIEPDEAANWLSSDMRAADDKATDLGTAFHRLAQYAVCTRKLTGALAYPPKERVAALEKACHLGAEDCARLRIALERWFASDIVQAIASRATLMAEVPFFVDLPVGKDHSEGIHMPGRATEHVFLEGEIDLLACDAAAHTGSFEGATAYVVDYKTGGFSTQDVRQLALKHVLQASCYAYALIRQGFAAVEATFVRVEQRSAADPDQPQSIVYRFAAKDKAFLEQAILQAYRQTARA